MKVENEKEDGEKEEGKEEGRGRIKWEQEEDDEKQNAVFFC